MNLRSITLINLVGISYIFVSRTAVTIFPEMLAGHTAVFLHGTLSLLFTVAVLLFYYYFRRDYLREPEETLGKAANLMVTASAGVSFLYLLYLLDITGLFSPDPAPFQALFPWVYSLAAVYFFTVFYREGVGKSRSGLKSALRLAIAGAAISALVRTLLVVNYLFRGQFEWLWGYAGRYPLLFFPVQGLVFISFFYFFFAFYRLQGSSGSR
ncbi:MAG: hypothetical protein GF417_11290 [Candidatus Latescibacteria bacterium]|nr:hypothetical protein [bacterium]MBD3425010.1 hypothetical protein [Candidatus Latescibacterota bacterium]